MKFKSFLLIFLAFIFIQLSFFTTYSFAQTKTKQTEYITKTELENLLKNTPSNLSKEDLTDMLLKNNEQLLESRKDKIELLEGNISSILALLAIILTVLTIIFASFGFWLRNNFTGKYDEVKSMKDEVERNKNAIDANMVRSQILNENLSNALNELKQSKEEFDVKSTNLLQEIRNVEALRNYIEKLETYLNFHLTNFKVMHDFEEKKKDVPSVIESVENLLKTDFTKEPYKNQLTDEIQQNIDYAIPKEMTMTLKDYFEEVYDYYKSSLVKEEESLLRSFNFMFKASKNILVDDDYKEVHMEEVEDAFNDWSGSLKSIDRVHKELKDINNKIIEYEQNHQK